MTFQNLNLHFPTADAFRAWLATCPAPQWQPKGSTYHNTFIPTAAQWRGHASMISMQQSYAAKGWDRGPHVFLALDTSADGIWVMTPPWLPGIHAGACNAKRFGLEVVGDFATQPMSHDQLVLLSETAAVLHDWQRLGPDIVAHRDCMPGRTCPGDAAYAQKADIQALVAFALQRPVEQRRALPLHGTVLTNVSGRDRLEDKIVAGKHTILKIIPSWGLDSAWTPDRRAWACALTGHTLIRSHVGDPSSGKPYPHAAEVVREVAPWYQIRRHNLFIELGNEPNSDPAIDPSGYAWHLNHAIAACRAQFPRAKLISPALVLDRPNVAQWATNPDMVKAVAQCDLLGVHVYAHVTFDDTGQLVKAQALYAASSQSRALTEYGIHDPKTADSVKGQRYAQFIRSLPSEYQIATYYHTDDRATAGINAAYALDLSGDVAYGNALEAT